MILEEVGMPENQNVTSEDAVAYFKKVSSSFSAAGALGQQSLNPQIRNNARFVSAIGDGFAAVAAAVDAADDAAFREAVRTVAEAAGSIAAGAAATSIITYGTGLALAALADTPLIGVLALPVLYPALALLASSVILYYLLDEASEFGEFFGGAVFDGLLSSTDWLSRLFGNHFFRRDPLVFDLDGNGVSLTELTGGSVYFDLNADGFAERTGWVSREDGLLVLDKNGNGMIDDGGELFGTSTTDGFTILREYDSNGDNQITDADAVWNNLQVWRDQNGDGVSQPGELLSMAETRVSAIGLASYEAHWDNRAGNGVLFGGSYTNTVGHQREVIAVAFNTDQVNTRYILPEDFAYDPDVFKLPNLRGYGQLPDLWVAMSLDPELKKMVQDFMASGPDSLDDLVGDVESGWNSYVDRNGDIVFFTVYYYQESTFDRILTRWAGVDISLPFAAIGRGQDILEMQAVVEKMMNREMLPGGRFTPDIVDLITDPSAYTAYVEFSTALATRFLAGWADIAENQTALNLFAGIAAAAGDGSTPVDPAVLQKLIDQAVTDAATAPALPPLLQHYAKLDYDFGTDSVGGDVASFIDEELAALPFDPESPWEGYFQWWGKRLLLLRTIDPTGAVTEERHRAHTQNHALPILLLPHRDILGDSGDNVLAGDATDIPGPDRLIGYAGNDSLAGGDGSDTYVFGDGFGNDLVVDASGSGDEIAFQQGLTSSRARFAFANGNRTDLLISFDGASDTVTVLDFFDAAGNPSIERISFGDGLSRTARSIRDEVMHQVATSGDDVITAFAAGSNIAGGAGGDMLQGSNYSEVLTGGADNDTLYGGGSDDVYMFNRGDGQDVVSDQSAWSWNWGSSEGSGWGYWNNGTDTIAFGAGIAPEDIEVIETGPDDLVLRIRGTADQITLSGTVSDWTRRIEEVHFANDIIWTHKDLLARITMATEGDDVHDGTIASETLDGDIGADMLYSGTGDDVLRSGADNDALFGEAGSDIIFGGDDGIYPGGTSDDLINVKVQSSVGVTIDGGDGYDILEMSRPLSVDSFVRVERIIVDGPDYQALQNVARSGLEALAALDNNADPVPNKEDARFGELKAWVDANGNDATNAGDSALISTSTFTRSNGSKGTAGNAALAYKPGKVSTHIDEIGTGNGGGFVSLGRLVSESSDISPNDNMGTVDIAMQDNRWTPVEQAAAILRGETSGVGLMRRQIGLLESGPDIVNIFDYYEQPDQLKTAGAAIGKEENSLRLADMLDALPHSQDLTTTVRPAYVDDAVLTGQASPDLSARMLALITQDMAAFGARGGESALLWRRDGVKPFELFA